MLRIRIIPILLLKNGRMVKPVQFGAGAERDVGDPASTARIYNSQDADELVFLDMTASDQGRAFLLDTLREVARNCFVPLTAGGGVKSVEDFREILRAGADKVSVNTAAVENPQLIAEAAKVFGSQAVVVAVDCKLNASHVYEVFTHGGKTATGLDPATWAKRAAELGAGEILLTSIDREGTMSGYDLELIKEVASAVSIPVIAAGGAGSRQHFVDVIQKTGASAAAASSVFHFTDSNLSQVKTFMFNAGLAVRPIN